MKKQKEDSDALSR